ncbi:hypothetical protein EV05_0454 [Prochlorococcus sp. MIT 0601]|nr:hypothetical protein EV05_0454 [Prochlorococcus sp. MIT 0601]
MGDSFQKAFLFVNCMALCVIAVQLIPFSREKELSNFCREYYALTKEKDELSQNSKISSKLVLKRGVISKKTGLNTEKNVDDFCNSFYFNQQ